MSTEANDPKVFQVMGIRTLYEEQEHGQIDEWMDLVAAAEQAATEVATFEAGVVKFLEGDYAGAGAIFRGVLDDQANDGTATHYSERCIAAVKLHAVRSPGIPRVLEEVRENGPARRHSCP